MSQKSKTLLQLLQQQQQSHNSYHEEANTSVESQYKKLSVEHTEKKQDLKLQKSILDLYNQIKTNILKSDDQLLLCQLRKIIPFDKQIEEFHQDLNQVICYIGCIFTQLFQDKVQFMYIKLNLEQQMEEQKAREQSDYEEQLIKLEAEIRQHIRVFIHSKEQIEQQLKLFAENTQSKLEDILKAKEEMEEENQQIKTDYQVLYDKFSTLNLKLKSSEQENQILKNEFNSFKQTTNPKALQKRDNNIENSDFNQRPIQINVQIDKLHKQHQQQSVDYYERIMTEPFDNDMHNKSKNESQKKIQAQKPTNNGYYAQRISTESYEIDTKKKRSNLSQHEINQPHGKHQRVKTLTSQASGLDKNQDLKRQPSNKTYHEHHKAIIANKPKKTTSQHSEVNRSNNSVHSFRKQNQTQISTDFSQIPRPFSSAEQIEELNHPSFHKDLSMDMGQYQKEHLDHSKQIQKLLQQYQQKHPLNDNLTKKLLQEYKKRQNYSKSIY